MSPKTKCWEGSSWVMSASTLPPRQNDPWASQARMCLCLILPLFWKDFWLECGMSDLATTLLPKPLSSEASLLCPCVPYCSENCLWFGNLLLGRCLHFDVLCRDPFPPTRVDMFERPAARGTLSQHLDLKELTDENEQHSGCIGLLSSCFKPYLALSSLSQSSL